MAQGLEQGLRVASGLERLDQLLGGLYLGDNLVWLDDSGNLYPSFCLNFMQASQQGRRPLIYISFDLPPARLLEKLGPLAQAPQLTILDCYTHGKGRGNETLRRFYQAPAPAPPCRVLPVEDPRDPARVAEAFLAAHAALAGEVRFIFDSLGGMQELWGSEEALLAFYAQACPRLRELETVAYWVVGKPPLDERLRAQIGHMAQVVVELSVRRGTNFLTVVKAEGRQAEGLGQPQSFWCRGLEVGFGGAQRGGAGLDLGARLRELRSLKGISQTDLARLVGVTPSTISQVESNLIYPSLPALLKMAEVLSVEVSSFFSQGGEQARRVVFPAAQAKPVRLADLPGEALSAQMLMAPDFSSRGEPYLLEIGPRQELSGHFFSHKGEELGYLLAGRLNMRLGKATYTLRAGDLIYLTNDTPSQWSNPGRSPARLLWIKIN